jgi:predicted Kef-type K+ transport protein
MGLLVTRAAIGPHGLSLVEDVHRVEVLAESGVVLLLFGTPFVGSGSGCSRSRLYASCP